VPSTFDGLVVLTQSRSTVSLPAAAKSPSADLFFLSSLFLSRYSFVCSTPRGPVRNELEGTFFFFPLYPVLVTASSNKLFCSFSVRGVGGCTLTSAIGLSWELFFFPSVPIQGRKSIFLSPSVFLDSVRPSVPERISILSVLSFENPDLFPPPAPLSKALTSLVFF